MILLQNVYQRNKNFIDKFTKICTISSIPQRSISMKKTQAKKVKYSLSETGDFIIENYNFSKPFANFFPGIAGKYGIPMWVFYVNRGQGIISCGTKSKDHSILEFFPANKAWQLVPYYGFRTFLKVSTGQKEKFYEPFQDSLSNLSFELNNCLQMNAHELSLSEENLSLGIRINVEYFNIPNEPFAGLTRIVTLKNTCRGKKRIEMLDGLPQIVPFGTSNLFLKKLGRTIEAWMQVKNLENNVPFYKLDVDPVDRPEVLHIHAGNFYLGFVSGNKGAKIIKPIINPLSIFGKVDDFLYPRQFLSKTKLIAPLNEAIHSKMPCGFFPLSLELAAGQEITFYSLIGYIHSVDALNSSIKRIANPAYLIQKRQENKELIKNLQQDIETISSSKEFNLYAKQTYLDNILRGGYPVTFKGDSTFYLYSRKHGDLERDYNKFLLQPTYFSQGNGNYRDTNQNRRTDIWFNPDINDENLIYFLNLLQTDGFNPLVVKGASFLLKEITDLKTLLKGLVSESQITMLTAFLNKPFTPGGLILFLETHQIKPSVSYDDFLALILSNSRKTQEAEHGEGFWTDHWTYNLDLLESYLGLYPEKFKEIFFERKTFTFYDNSEVVKPRREKYVMLNGLIKQLHSVASDTDKKALIAKREKQPHVVRANYGLGEIYYTTLIDKLLCLVANKLASLDPSGIGIEMEADKPNWFDSLNGLPALFGSSLCETFELKRLILLIITALKKEGIERILVTEEFLNLLSSLNKLIETYLSSKDSDKDFQYWDKSYSLKEEYRQKTKLGLSGATKEIPSAELLNILNNALSKINSGIEKALDKRQNLYCSYFAHEMSEYEIIHDPVRDTKDFSSLPLVSNEVKAKKFIQKRLPLFLEGQMHALRLAEDVKNAIGLYKATKASQLYDKELKMYKVTAALETQPLEIGRCRAFTPGWLENESIWLHMEYKYLLEILKQGLYEEFFAEFKNVLIPFQKPERYGRSILENSSFLVSSAFPDKNLHGNGFVARLSGSTAEFLQIWLIMNIGNKPFFLNNAKEINLKFNPTLAGWLFDKNGKYTFNFLGKISVTYHNPKKKDTFGKNAAKINRISFNDRDRKAVEFTSDTIPHPYAEQIRLRQVKKIDILLD